MLNKGYSASVLPPFSSGKKGLEPKEIATFLSN